jgi:hypothetical protein
MNNNVRNDYLPKTYQTSTRQWALEAMGGIIGCWYGYNIATFPCSTVACCCVGRCVGDIVYYMATPDRTITSQPIGSSNRVNHHTQETMACKQKTS